MNKLRLFCKFLFLLLQLIQRFEVLDLNNFRLGMHGVTKRVAVILDSEDRRFHGDNGD